MPDIFIMLLVMSVTGALAGLGAGLFGIGGGAIMVPALYFAFMYLGYDQSTVMHMAVATSSAVIIVNAIRSVKAHDALGNVDWNLLWPKPPWNSYAIWIGIGAFIASLAIAPRLSGQHLTLIFAALALLIALQFIFGRPNFVISKTIPGGLALPGIGSIVGVLSALIGIGGGSLTVPLMSLCSVPIHRAIGTASGFGFAIGGPATLGYIMSGWNVPMRAPYSLGYVNIPSFFFLTMAAFLCVPLGAKLANRLPQNTLKRVFGICLFLVALNLIRKIIF